MPWPRRAAFAIVTASYVVAAAVAVVVLTQTSQLHVIARFVIADVAATVTVFLASRLANNSSVYDPYWSVAPPLIAGYLWYAGGSETSLRELASLLLVAWWGFRLTANWARGWRGFGHEDWRYVQLKQQLGRWWWPVSLLGIHLLPTSIVLLGCLPLYVIHVAGAAPVNGWDVAGVGIGATAILLETRADRELARFIGMRASPQAVLQTGLWRWCRHPNYLGEIGFWVGLACLGIGANSAAWWPLIGALAMIMLFVGVSIPLIERKLLAEKPDYAGYCTRTPALLPWHFPRD
jgi:steroid 5-alpha reductase family enzyme